MNKLFSLLVLIAISTTLLAQKKKNKDIEFPPIPMNESTQKMEYKGSVSVSGDKAETYKKAKGHMTSFYKNPKNVIKKDDMAAGIIEGKGQFRLYAIDKKGNKNYAGLGGYTATLTISAGKIDYVITDFNHKQASYTPAEYWLDKDAPLFDPQFANFAVQLDREALRFIDALKKVE